jgi:hypothetical protein
MKLLPTIFFIFFLLSCGNECPEQSIVHDTIYVDTIYPYKKHLIDSLADILKKKNIQFDSLMTIAIADLKRKDSLTRAWGDSIYNLYYSQGKIRAKAYFDENGMPVLKIGE